MIFVFVFIGITVGMLLGLTGAGGAILAIPLFVYLVGATIREATVYSLILVLTGAFINWWPEKNKTNFKVGSTLFIFSILGVLIFKPIKELIPDGGIIFTYSMVSLVSLVSVWKKKPKHEVDAHSSLNQKEKMIKTLIGGILMGGVSTITGLSGGIVSLPLLINMLYFNLEKAAATSMFAIICSAGFILIFERNIIFPTLDAFYVFLLIVANIFSAVATKFAIGFMETKQFEEVRKFLLTVVIALAVVGLLFANR